MTFAYRAPREPRPTDRPKLARIAGFGVAASLVAGVLSGIVSCRSAGVGPIYMSLDPDGNRRRTTFYTDTTAIYCVAEIASGREDVTVTSLVTAEALWSDAEQRLVPVSEIWAQGELAPGATALAPQAFKLLQAPAGSQATDLPYPVGHFTCHVLLDGEEQGSTSYSVVFPDCPLPAVMDGVPCKDWVRQGSVCPGVLDTMCTCGASGAWSC